MCICMERVDVSKWNNLMNPDEGYTDVCILCIPGFCRLTFFFLPKDGGRK